MPRPASLAIGFTRIRKPAPRGRPLADANGSRRASARRAAVPPLVLARGLVVANAGASRSRNRRKPGTLPPSFGRTWIAGKLARSPLLPTGSRHEIARSLGMRPAAAADLVRKLAADRNAADPRADVVDCWVNAGWSTGLSVAGHPEWSDPGADAGTGGPVSAVVARRRHHRRSVTVCVYLIDAYCLGVLVARLGRKRPSPLARGDVRIWRGGDRLPLLIG
jgi:hypothetical protein